MTTHELVLRYSFFAACAMALNFAVQHLTLEIYDGSLALFAALGAGTGAGLVLKYLLDKHWIFRDTSRGTAAHGAQFGLYTLTGLFTTAIFWGSEIGFDRTFGTWYMRDLGAALGLIVGYITKYHIDKRVTFAARSPA